MLSTGDEVHIRPLPTQALALWPKLQLCVVLQLEAPLWLDQTWLWGPWSPRLQRGKCFEPWTAHEMEEFPTVRILGCENNTGISKNLWIDKQFDVCFLVLHIQIINMYLLAWVCPPKKGIVIKLSEAFHALMCVFTVSGGLSHDNPTSVLEESNGTWSGTQIESGLRRFGHYSTQRNWLKITKKK